jgi:large subunit ribosomal protein L25
MALLQQVQHHPLTGAIVHVDLHEVSPDEKVIVSVPVETVGEPAGVKTGGGTLEHVLFKVKVRALPRDLPEFIAIDVTAMEVDQTIHVRDMQVPAGVEILGDPGVSVVSVTAPRQVVEETAAPAEAVAAPASVEMIKEKKDEKGKPEGEAKPAKK